MLLLFGALLEPGDEVVLSRPVLRLLSEVRQVTPDGVPVYVPVDEDDAFQFRPEAVARRARPAHARPSSINSPANPTGDGAGAGAAWRPSRASGRWIVSDEIYHGLTYEGPEHTVLEFTDRAFVLNGFSKAFAMTGWRVGYVIAPREFMRAR